MTTKAKARALAKARMKPKRKQEKLLSEQQAIAEEKQRMLKLTEEKGVKGLALVTFDHLLKDNEHRFAQAGALGIYRDHLKTTLPKTRLSLQAYDNKLVEISGIITEAKYNSSGSMTAIMIASPFVKVSNSSGNFVDSHLWFHLNTLARIEDEEFEFEIALGCMATIQGIVTSYKSHSKYKYGFSNWAFTNCGVSYFIPNGDKTPKIVNVGQNISQISCPMLKIENTLETVDFAHVSEEHYHAQEKILLDIYKEMLPRITPAGKNILRNFAKKAQRK